MSDIREVDWLPLDAALERLSRGYERAFLENVGPIALQAAANAERERRARLRAAAAERRRARLAADEPVVDAAAIAEVPVDAEAPVLAETPVIAEAPVAAEAAVDAEAVAPIVVDPPEPVEGPVTAEPSDVVATQEPDQPATMPEHAGEAVETDDVVAAAASEPPQSSTREIEPVVTAVQPIPRKNLIERVRDWLRRAA